MIDLTPLPLALPMSASQRRRQYKNKWQREKRREFERRNGFSTATNYGGLRAQVLTRDKFACVVCGMTDAQHRQRWGRPITVDHRNRNRRVNTMENLQTLCLTCHGRKDLLPRLREPRVLYRRREIIERRQRGETYQVIADATGFSIGSVWKWLKRWGVN